MSNNLSSSQSSSDDDFQPRRIKPGIAIASAAPSAPSRNAEQHSGANNTGGAKSTTENKLYMCRSCPYKSNKKWNVDKHEKTHRNESPQVKIPHSCATCDYSTTKTSSWKEHQASKLHLALTGNNAMSGTFKCPVSGCAFGGHRLDRLRNHIEKVHKIPLHKEIIDFVSLDAFKSWKYDLQVTQAVKFVKTHASTGKSQVYECHRSGDFIPRGKGIRYLKKKGSIKCGRQCPAGLVVKTSDSGCKVTYWKSHIGHDNNPGRVGIPSPQKRALAASLKEGIPKDVILHKLQKEQMNAITPMSLLKNQDLVNIEKKFGISKGIMLHSNDAESIQRKYLQLQESGDYGIFFYKALGEDSIEYPSLRKEDFVLAYMNNAQEHLLRTHGENIICIDSTHGTNGYNYEMTSILIINDEFEGFPVAFFFHSSKTQETYTNFLRALKKRVGSITCKKFMSDDEPAFWNAWENVMEGTPQKLLCAWHVLRNWNKKLLSVDRQTRAEYTDKLRATLYELNPVDFELAFQNLLVDMKTNKVTSQLWGYFCNYWDRRKEWAYCYRNHAGINTNMRLERMHRELKQRYLKGKKVKRLDIGFHAVLTFLKHKQHDRIVAQYRGKVYSKDHLLRAAHKKSLDVEIDKVQDCGNYWVVQSFNPKTSSTFYTVEKNVEGCICEVRCPKCFSCIHAYKCSCMQNAIQANMCKHVHLVCRSLKDTTAQQESTDDEADIDLCIDTNAFQERRNEEIQSHLMDLRVNEAGMASFTKETSAEMFSQVNEMATDHHDYEILQECLAKAKEKILARRSAIVAFPMADSVRKQPGNMKAEQQRRSFVRKTCKRPKPSAPFDQSDIMRTLLPLRLIPTEAAPTLHDHDILPSENVPYEEEVVVE